MSHCVRVRVRVCDNETLLFEQEFQQCGLRFFLLSWFTHACTHVRMYADNEMGSYNIIHNDWILWPPTERAQKHCTLSLYASTLTLDKISARSQCDYVRCVHYLCVHLLCVMIFIRFWAIESNRVFIGSPAISYIRSSAPQVSLWTAIKQPKQQRKKLFPHRFSIIQPNTQIQTS